MATQTLFPTADAVAAQWDTIAPATPTTHFDKVDEGTTTPSDADYIETVTLNDVDEFTFGTTPNADIDTVTQIDVSIRAQIDDAGASTVIRLELFEDDGSTAIGSSNPQDVTTANLGGSGTLATVTKSWTSLTATKADVTNMRLKHTFMQP